MTRRRNTAVVLALGAAGVAALVIYRRRRAAAADSAAAADIASEPPLPYFAPWGPLSYDEFVSLADQNAGPALPRVNWVVTAWPFSDAHKGETAVRFAPASYAALANAHLLPSVAGGVQATARNDAIYVLAQAITGDTRVIETQPHTMTRIESLENTIFSTGDTIADKLGLPSLDSLEKWLKDVGRDVAIGVVVLAVVGVLVHKALKD